MNLSEKRDTNESNFFNSQICHCRFSWVFKNRIIKNIITWMRGACVYGDTLSLCGDTLSYFKKLLEQDKSLTIHTWSLQMLATKMLKTYKNIFSLILSEAFHLRDMNHNLRIEFPVLS